VGVRRRTVAVIAVIALVGALAVAAGARSLGGRLALPHLGPRCTVTADGQVSLDPVQMANAATISAVGVRRGMPEQAVVVALATALQESKLENREDGDRDSVGLFQQRPSQGWGAAEKLQDPRYAADRFYAALSRVKGWKSMRVTDAAQQVQRSAYPAAYEKWADESAVLARALLGHATGAVACTVPGQPVLRGAAATAALTLGLRRDWGTGLDRIAARQEAAVTVAVSEPSAGWRYAHWLVSHAGATGLARVTFGDLQWRASGGTWQPVTGDGPTDTGRVVAEVFT
jgi:hypothetical protein